MKTTLLALFCLLSAAVRAQDSHPATTATESRTWQRVFSDPGTRNWELYWTLDGADASVRNTPQGLVLKAGSDPKAKDNHAVLWTRASFDGDVRIEYDFTRLDDSQTNSVNIIYIQAQGYGKEPYVADISKWADLRTKPAMGVYYNHMDTYHLSYSTAGDPGAEESRRYIRGRRYMPELGKGLKGTELTPEYLDVDLFQTGVKYHITIIKSGNQLHMRVCGSGRDETFNFDGSAFPPIESGRIGLRQMHTRTSCYANFQVFVAK